MDLVGQLQLGLWRLRLRLREHKLLRSLVERLRGLGSDSRDRHLRGEVGFWRRWLRTRGLSWPDDFARRFDPDTPVQPQLARLIDRLEGQQVEILDVGAGPVTVVGKRHPGKTVSVTATDVLARDYAQLLADFGLTAPSPTVYAEAEKLQEQLGDRQFDIVHAQNSIDHCADPIAAIGQMLAVTRPGGFVLLLHEENEGSNELYHALHKWDFTCERGHFVIAGPGPDGPRRDVTAMLAGSACVECALGAGAICVTIRKLAGSKSR